MKKKKKKRTTINDSALYSVTQNTHEQSHKCTHTHPHSLSDDCEPRVNCARELEERLERKKKREQQQHTHNKPVQPNELVQPQSTLDYLMGQQQQNQISGDILTQDGIVVIAAVTDRSRFFLNEESSQHKYLAFSLNYSSNYNNR